MEIIYYRNHEQPAIKYNSLSTKMSLFICKMAAARKRQNKRPWDASPQRLDKTTDELGAKI